MKKLLLSALPVVAAFASCQQAATNPDTPVVQSAPAPTDGGAATEGAARAALRRYIQGQPQANLYVVDSAALVEVDAEWQALVPRTDWAGRMPNRAAFQIDKLTGEVRPRPVK
ncbi:hypothetical protein [Hymenobacter sp. CRA2]|uniref:hypothetical protein n=1 Tax=Hymenobacter sp. CRA2 TaxID=1955620 RepID=UPI00098F22F9|nr:hypothetical protein [Hymenobacter sp. CRA2]OON67854.1 hypothetical protein B0919_16885 [Hymenobacter sp. CRA2]